MTLKDSPTPDDSKPTPGFSVAYRAACLPSCDVCKDAEATYDAATIYGPWGYLCPSCFASVGVGLGVGRGQRLILTTEGA